MGGRRTANGTEPTSEDRPETRAAFHRRARRQGGDAQEPHAPLRLRAVEEARPEALRPGPSPTSPGASNWVPLGPAAIPGGQSAIGGGRVLVSGRVTAIAVDPVNPSILYVGSARGGVWKSEDSGKTWKPKSDNEASLAIGALALAPSSPKVLYAGTGEGNIYRYRLVLELNSINESYEGSGILKSADGGETWALLGVPTFVGACFYRLAVHPTDPNTVFAATSLGLHRSTDGGASWALLSNGLPAVSLTNVIGATDVVVDPRSPETVYVAFWKKGVFVTTTAGAANPSFTAIGGLPASITRVTLALAPSDSTLLYALISDANDQFAGVYRTSGGATPAFSALNLVGTTVINRNGAYNASLAVDSASPDVIYIGGVSLYQGTRKPSGEWQVWNVGDAIHADHHALVSHPTDHNQIFAGTDGGIFRSKDAGATWEDSINSGLCLAQLEFSDQHPTSDAVVFAGTQDNGTEQFRNSPVFHHAGDGDGGAVIVDQQMPTNVIRTEFELTPQISGQGGTRGSFSSLAAGLSGQCLFYPPMVADPTNSRNLAFGTESLRLDAAQGSEGWPVTVALPGISGFVSAIAYVDSGLIYTGTTSGQVYRAVRSGSAWTATQISAAPLPARWIWDVAVLPGTPETVVVVMSGFGTPHVHRGSVAAGGGSATWTDISGTAPNRLPDVPVNSLQVDPASASVIYVGTDIGVFRTADGGANWAAFNNGLPNTAVYDLRLHGPTRLLRAATHGRGLWEHSLDLAPNSKPEIFVRDHQLSTGRRPTPNANASFADPLQGIALNAYLDWWLCQDIKVDAPTGTPPGFQMAVDAVDYVAFESKLEHRDIKRGVVNRVYAQIHNRGILAAEGATVKLLFAPATSGAPGFPQDFWARFPLDSLEPSVWAPIDPVKTVPPVSTTQPVVLEWDWTPPADAAEHSCILVVIDCPADPIPAENKFLGSASLARSERHAGMRNLHVVSAAVGAGPTLAELTLWAAGDGERLRLLTQAADGSLGLLLPRGLLSELGGSRFSADEVEGELREMLDVRAEDWEARGRREGRGEPVFREPALVRFEGSGAVLDNLPRGEYGLTAFLVAWPHAWAREADVNVTLVQEREGSAVGGNTYVLRPAAAGLDETNRGTEE